MGLIKSLSVIIPVFNEEPGIKAILSEVSTGLKTSGTDFEIIVINDGSSDGSGQCLSELACSFPALKVITHERNSGKGKAIRSGIAVASKDWTLIIDADQQISLSELEVFSITAAESETVVGYRCYQSRKPLSRQVVSWLYKILVHAFYVRVRDCGCPFKLIKTALLRDLPLSANGFGIDAELLLEVSRRGKRIVELPVQSHMRKTGVSKVTASSCVSCLLELLRIRISKLH